MPQVFISCSNSDLSFVKEHVVGVCRNSGYEPWYYDERINPAEEWDRKILNAIRESVRLLLLMSPDSKESEWVGAEVHEAIRIGISVIPLMIKDCIPSDIHLLLGKKQYIDFREDISKGCQRLAKSLSGTENQPPAIEMDDTSELITIAVSLLPRQEVKHLRNLVLGRAQKYIGCSSMRHEIRHLCDLGLLKRKKNRQIGHMTDKAQHDLSTFVEFTSVGKLIAKKLTGVQKS